MGRLETWALNLHPLGLAPLGTSAVSKQEENGRSVLPVRNENWAVASASSDLVSLWINSLRMAGSFRILRTYQGRNSRRHSSMLRYWAMLSRLVQIRT